MVRILVTNDDGIYSEGIRKLADALRSVGEVVIVIVFTAVVTTALAFTALMWAQAHVSATEAAVILAFEPVAASLTSILWDREPITVSFLAGATLILAAMIVSQTSVTIQTDGPNPRHQ